MGTFDSNFGGEKRKKRNDSKILIYINILLTDYEHSIYLLITKDNHRVYITMVKRKSMGTTEETAFSSSSSSSSTKLSSPTTTTSTSTSSKTSNNRSATKGTVTDTLNDASILPIKVRRIELIEELKDAWNSSVVKANKGRPKDQITVLQTVLPVLHKQLFTSLRKHLVQDDELGKYIQEKRGTY